MTVATRSRADNLVCRFAASIRAAQLYSSDHPIITRNVDTFARGIESVHRRRPKTIIGVVGDEIIVDDVPVARGPAIAGLVHRLQQAGVERITIERGVEFDELRTLVDVMTGTVPDDVLEDSGTPRWAHVRVGRVTAIEGTDSSTRDMATIKRLYADAVSVAGGLWDTAVVDGKPDPTAARGMIDGLAQAVEENRTALVALTALKHYDNYTFTHMVNVSLLTMAQARSLGVDGAPLRELGFAALMHDIGKVRTPLEILNKPEALTPAEFETMKRHTVDGAEILRRTPDVPPLAPIVALEHHLRLDGSGYPDISRPTLNLATMLCSIADVFDAMRTNRHYQNAFPTDRILAVLRGNDGRAFDQHLVRRFVQLIGIYPPGNLVRLDTGELAVVLEAHAPDPHRPRVRVVTTSDGHRLALPFELNLWDSERSGEAPRSIAGLVDPAEHKLDPLMLM